MSTMLLSQGSKPNLTLISEKSDIIRNIYTGTAQNFLGNCFIAWTEDMICFLAFGNDEKIAIAKKDLQKLWPGSSFDENNHEAKHLISNVFNKNKAHSLLIKGTPFQEKVWRALMNIKVGTLVSYEELGASLGGKNFTRAAASAVAKNNISYLIPCHRVIRKSGDINKYRWGVSVKKQLLEWESGILK